MQKIVSFIVSLLNKLLRKFGVAESRTDAFVKYLFNTGWMFAEKVLFMAIAFFVGIYVARYLGPARYGALNYAFSFVFIFQAFAQLGLEGIVIRELVKTPENKLKILGTSFRLKLFGSLFSFALILIAIQFTNSTFDEKIMVIILAAGVFFNIFEVTRFFFESQVKAKFSATANSVAVIISAGYKVILIIIEADLIWFATVFSAEIVIRGIVLIVIYQNKNSDICKWYYDKQIAKSLIRDSWALLLSGVAVVLYMKIDQVMLKEMLGTEAVGQYSVAVQLSEIWYFIPIVITNSLFPAIIDAKRKGKEFYHKRLQQLYNLMTFIALAVMIPAAIFSNQIILLLFGENYIEAGEVLRIHILSLLFVFWGLTSGKWLINENYVKISMYRTIVGAVLNIILNIFLIKYYRINGAAFATLFSYALSGYLFDILYKKTHIAFKMKNKSIFFLN